MGTTLRSNLGTGSRLGKGTFNDKRRLNSFSALQSVASFRVGTHTSTPEVANSGRSSQSRQSSSEFSSDIAAEIVVWTEDMDLDVASSGDSDESSPMSTEYVSSYMYSASAIGLLSPGERAFLT